MTWIIRVGDETVSSDDFTIEDLGNIETSAGTIWSVANPLREAKIAKAFLAVAMLHLGKTEQEVIDALNTITLKTLKNTFSLVPDEEEGDEAADPTQDRPAQISRGSSRGPSPKVYRRAPSKESA